MLLHQADDGIQLHAAESTGTLQGNRVQPDLRHPVLAPDVDVRRLTPIQGHEEEAIGTYSEDRGHAIAILPHRVEISTNWPGTVAGHPGWGA